MSRRHPIPDVNALGGLDPKCALHAPASLFGAHQRDNQIQLRAGIDRPADAAQNSIHFPECSETVDIDGCEHGTLLDQFLFVHRVPRVLLLSRGKQSTVHFWTQSDSTAGSQNHHNNSPCGRAASDIHHAVQCTPTCKMFNFEHVNTTNIFSPISIQGDAA